MTWLSGFIAIKQCHNAHIIHIKMYRIYIGSNNKTKKLEKRKIEQIVSRYYDGFTLYEAMGYWQGIKEKSAIVEIGGDSDISEGSDMIRELLRVLKQQAVAIQKLPEMSFVSL